MSVSATESTEAASVLLQVRARLSQADWWPDRGCAGMPTSDFISDGGTGHPDGTEAGRAACERCTVRLSCLEYAIQSDSVGWWGGTNYNERRKMRADRSRAA